MYKTVLKIAMERPSTKLAMNLSISPSSVGQSQQKNCIIRITPQSLNN